MTEAERLKEFVRSTVERFKQEFPSKHGELSPTHIGIVAIHAVPPLTDQNISIASTVNGAGYTADLFMVAVDYLLQHKIKPVKVH